MLFTFTFMLTSMTAVKYLQKYDGDIFHQSFWASAVMIKYVFVMRRVNVMLKSCCMTTFRYFIL